MTPEDRKYAKSHEWVKVEGELAVVGISDHAQEALGDITFVELPSVGDTFSRGDEFGVIESVKAASDLYAPIGGEVVQVNTALEDTPGLVNDSAFDKGWLIKLKGINGSELEGLLTAEDYEGSAE